MFDELLAEDPYILKIKANAEARGKAEGRTEEVREDILAVIEARFPALSEYAFERVSRINTLDVLKLLLKRLVIAADEEEARSILALPTA